jgi:hypothetical protein
LCPLLDSFRCYGSSRCVATREKGTRVGLWTQIDKVMDQNVDVGSGLVAFGSMLTRGWEKRPGEGGLESTGMVEELW